MGAIYSTATAVDRGVHLRCAAGKYHTRLQTQNSDRVAAFKRQGIDLFTAKGMAKGGVLRVNQFGISGDLDLDRFAFDLELHIQSASDIDEQPYAFLFHGSETGRCCGDRISSWRQLEKLIRAFVIGGGGLAKAGLGIAHDYGCARDDRAGGSETTPRKDVVAV